MKLWWALTTSALIAAVCLQADVAADSAPPSAVGEEFKGPGLCTCELRCCANPSITKRSVMADTLNLPLVRHKRCCGCQTCEQWSQCCEVAAK